MAKAMSKSAELAPSTASPSVMAGYSSFMNSKKCTDRDRAHSPLQCGLIGWIATVEGI